jgi:hypothetical protein
MKDSAGRLTSLDLQLAWNPTEIDKPWSIQHDQTGSGWTIRWQRWGDVVLEDSATGNEHCLTVHVAQVTRERLEVNVTLNGIGGIVLKSETVRHTEVDLVVSRLVNTLLEGAV